MLILRHCRLSSEDLITAERVMLRYISGRMRVTSLGFNVWDHTIPEIYGILLGMFIKLGLLECLDITAGELLDFIIDVDRGYMATYYHSFYHAADVTAVLFHFLDNLSASQYLAKVDMVVLLLAGLCHDIGHPGLNNLFQVNAETELYKQFGEASVLEKYSCSLAMDLCTKHSIFRNVHKSTEATLPEGHQPNDATMREAMIKAIMATDMSVHYNMLNNLNMLIEVTSSPSSSPASSPTSSDAETDPEADDDNEDEQRASPIKEHSLRPHHSCCGAAATAIATSTITAVPASARKAATLGRSTCFHGAEADENRDELTPVAPQPNSIPNQQRRVTISSRRRSPSNSSTASTESDSSDVSTGSNSSTQTPHSLECRSPSDLSPELRQILCQCLLHAADISNAVKPWELCRRWSDLVIQEFFRQGDIEKAQNLPVSPNMDREMHNQPQISLGFGDFVVQPYFESLAEFLPAASELLDTLTSNRAHWVSLQKAAAQETESKQHLQVGPVETPTPNVNVSAPATPTLTTGRRVSVAAGVLTLEETRPSRPPHRRLRHSTNTEPQHHLLRKMKRSLSGRSLSSALHNLHIHPSIPRLNLSSCKEPAATALKKQAVQHNKDTPVVAGHFVLPVPGSMTTSTLPPLPPTHSSSGSLLNECSCYPSMEGPISTQGGNNSGHPHRLRRHGSLQLEHQNPHRTSIRQEYGDGYVVIHDPRDCDFDGHHIPYDSTLTTTITSSSTPIDATAVANRQSTPAVLSRQPFNWYSPPGSIGTFSLRAERAGYGPLDDDTMEPAMTTTTAASAVSAMEDPYSIGPLVSSVTHTETSAPVQATADGAPKKKSVDAVPKTLSSSALVGLDGGSKEDDKSCRVVPQQQNGSISIATANAGHGPPTKAISLVSVDSDGEGKTVMADPYMTPPTVLKEERQQHKVDKGGSGSRFSL
ncbi:hypothetical protein DFQ27_001923 [Actinomortierella ambigua]|uniref:Phosphodiesterase n=1 Tax=Actinomortierella ambigua TaxID=1343610 RepID=A0A9P6QCA9_9FUNG|nr:hypothetical protein DFQ27_001923 [Actinomortierella ambigua]